MIIFKLHPHYNRKEIRALTDMMRTIKDEIHEASTCTYTRKDCRKCEYRNLCKDVTNAVHHLKNQ